MPGWTFYLAFRYMTDWSTYYDGWYIWDVYVDGELITDGSDISMFMDLTELFPIENDFSVTLVAFKNTMFGPTYVIKKIVLNDLNEIGYTTPSQLFYSYDKVAMIVTYDAAEGVTEYAMYNVYLYMMCPPNPFSFFSFPRCPMSHPISGILTSGARK